MDIIPLKKKLFHSAKKIKCNQQIYMHRVCYIEDLLFLLQTKTKYIYIYIYPILDTIQWGVVITGKHGWIL